MQIEVSESYNSQLLCFYYMSNIAGMKYCPPPFDGHAAPRKAVIKILHLKEVTYAGFFYTVEVNENDRATNNQALN